MRTIDVVTYVLLIIGALNWGLTGLFNFDLVAWIFGAGTIVSRVIYCLVGLSALYEVFAWRVIKRRWGIGHFLTTEPHPTPTA
jgi:uncharacterized membrane protein YuzA (DUF378 family)